MAKPKKRRKNTKKSSPPDASTDILAADGTQALESGNFPKAIHSFKQLLKQDPCRKWQDELACAYRGRARALSAKGMSREALVILDNLAHFCPDVAVDESLLPFRVQLLIGVGRPDKAAVQYGLEANRVKGTETGGALDELFAALILAEEDGVLSALPEDAPPVAHASFARQALRAYCQKEHEETARQLKQIPSRSPYRYFVLALKGLMTMDTEPFAAMRLFAKIPQASPFYPLVRPFVPGTEKDASLAVALGHMSREELQLLAAVKGFDEKRLAFLISFAKAGSQPQKLIPLLCNQGKELDAQWAQSLCKGLLPLCPKMDIAYTKAFGFLPKDEAYRLQALTFEHNQDWELCLDGWEKYAELLASPPRTAEKQLSIALVYRHMAEIAHVLESDDFADIDQESRYVGCLAKSLTYDPADKPTYLKLFDRCRNDKKLMRQWLGLALEEFPQDIDMLLMAAKVALEGGAFKKTASYVARILAVDPINTGAKSLLLRAHLSHGRKLANTGKLIQASREFALAEEQQRSPSHIGVARICQGLVKILAGEEPQGQAFVEEGCQLVGLPCKAWLITAVEADLLKLPPGRQRKIHQQLKACAATNLSKVEFFDLLEQFKLYKQQASRQMQRVGRFIQPLLKNSADLGFTQDESSEICNYFFQEKRFDLLQPFATVAEKNWPVKPIFTFYRLYAKVCGFAHNLSERELKALDRAAEDAMAQNDIYAAELIADFITPFGASFSNPFHCDGKPGDVPRKILEAIFGDLDEEDWFDPLPDKKKEPKKVPQKASKEVPEVTRDARDDPFEQLELF